MNKTIERLRVALIVVGTVLAVTLGLVTFASVPAQADDGDSITVESVSYSKDTASATASDAVNIKVNGATQLLWWYPNHHVKVTMKAVRKAPRIKVNYAPCSRQSKSIAKQANGASIVVAKSGSVICNTGKNGNIVGGFKWTVGHPAVLKWNKKLRLYQHVYSIVNGKLAKRCGNWMGGHVDVMYPSVVQVRFEGDLEQESDVEAEANVTATVQASKDCPGGKVYASASADASASATAKVQTKLKYMVSATNAKKAELIASVKSKVKASAEAKAEAKITITCGKAPVAKPQLLEIDTINDVLVNNTRMITPKGTVASGHTATLFCSAGVGSITSGKSQTVSGSFNAPITYKAPDEPGTDKVTCTLTQDDGQKDSISTNEFKIKVIPPDPM